MINIRLATEDDKEEWNKVVEQSENGTIYHTWEWKQVIEQGLGDKGYHVIAEKDGEIVGIFPLFNRPSLKYSKLPLTKNIFQVVWSPHIQVWGYGGPCILGSNKEVLEELFKYIEYFIKKNKRIMSLRVLPYKNHFETFYSKNNFVSKTWQTSYIDLTKSLDELCKNFKKEHRRAIKQAIKRGLILTEPKNYSELKEIYNIFLPELISHISIKSKKHSVYSPKYLPFSYFKAIFDILVPKEMAKINFAEHNGNKIGFEITLFYKDLMIAQHNASLREYSNFRANNLFKWEIIKEGKNLGYNIFDLTGMAFDKDDGVHRFKAGWSGERKQLKWYYKEYRFERIRKFKRKILK